MNAAIANEIRGVLDSTHWTQIQTHSLKEYLVGLPDLSAHYLRILRAIQDSKTPKSQLRHLLLDLVARLRESHGSHHRCSFLETYISEFAIEGSYSERSQICKTAHLENPDNLRALYLHFFFAQVGKPYQYALFNRYRLYSLLQREIQDKRLPICLSPLLGVSIGHYYLLMQACRSQAPYNPVRVFVSEHQIGGELLEFLRNKSREDFEILECSSNLCLYYLADAFYSDILAYSFCVTKYSKSPLSYSSQSSTICLHVRTEGYKMQGGLWNLLRNATPSNFEQLGKHINNAENDSHLVRICCPGDLTLEQSCWNSHIVSDSDSALMQWQLINGSKYFLGCNSGISALAPFLASRMLVLNATSLWSVVALDQRVIFALKTIRDMKPCTLRFTREEFICLLYLDWVGSEGLTEFFEIEELSSDNLVRAYIESTSGKTRSLSSLSSELGVTVPVVVPERYITESCAANIKEVALSLDLDNTNTYQHRLSKIMWQ